ncbi:Low-density lipoprotein receptor-related protein 1B [Thelohanellus kitauei]|uniref:Low-density lipoprotein receptor-related protein 1B n=1 Tax=Thelohanellus kitauei TaxID=669202 RepID=A0A0C2NK52_THEKT|nr:Low-density lipoprotein receptor-related protein 1B [Thelohanellus kitauei]
MEKRTVLMDQMKQIVLKNEFLCFSTNECISLDKICNENIDCPDSIDEIDCIKGFQLFYYEKSKCGNGTFECFNQKCIDINKVCDGNNDCGDSSDEEDCKAHKCRNYGAFCDDGQCILASQICDDVFDCKDFSDESACTNF